MMVMLVVASLAAMPAMPATDPAAKAAVAAYIARCSEEWAQQGVVAQPEVIERCLADDYQGISVRGTLVTKTDLLAPYVPKGRAAGVYYTRPRFLSPEFVIVQGEEWFEPKDGSGKRHQIWIDVWSFRDGKWQVVSSQDSVVPFDQPLLNPPD